MSPGPEFEPFALPELSTEEARHKAHEFYQLLKTRRSVREFSTRSIPQGIIQDAILAAGTAPNGANLQPWHFAVIESPGVKKRIRQAAEQEEQAFYSTRAPRTWLDDLSALGTNAQKPFLENAPALIVIFQKNRVTRSNGREDKAYYPKESVGIATGILLTALHQAGLATLTHTPSPMGFLNEILDRPSTEKPFLLLVVGYPTDHCRVPKIKKLPFSCISSFH